MPKVYMARLLRLIQHANLRLPSSNTTGSIHSSPSAPISTLDWVSSCANNLKSKRASRFYITGIMVFWNYPSILVKFSQDQAKILLELHTNPSHRKYSTNSIKVWQVLRLVSNSNVLYVKCLQLDLEEALVAYLQTVKIKDGKNKLQITLTHFVYRYFLI